MKREAARFHPTFVSPWLPHFARETGERCVDACRHRHDCSNAWRVCSRIRRGDARRGEARRRDATRRAGCSRTLRRGGDAVHAHGYADTRILEYSNTRILIRRDSESAHRTATPRVSNQSDNVFRRCYGDIRTRMCGPKHTDNLTQRQFGWQRN